LSDIDVIGIYPVKLFGRARAISWVLISETCPRTKDPGTRRYFISAYDFLVSHLGGWGYLVTQALNFD
jgi:hypothetical protein